MGGAEFSQECLLSPWCLEQNQRRGCQEFHSSSTEVTEKRSAVIASSGLGHLLRVVVARLFVKQQRAG